MTGPDPKQTFRTGLLQQVKSLIEQDSAVAQKSRFLVRLTTAKTEA